jgi:hypothetical protein
LWRASPFVPAGTATGPLASGSDDKQQVGSLASTSVIGTVSGAGAGGSGNCSVGVSLIRALLEEEIEGGLRLLGGLKDEGGCHGAANVTTTQQQQQQRRQVAGMASSNLSPPDSRVVGSAHSTVMGEHKCRDKQPAADTAHTSLAACEASGGGGAAGSGDHQSGGRRRSTTDLVAMLARCVGVM